MSAETHPTLVATAPSAEGGGFGPGRRLQFGMALTLLAALAIIAVALTRPWSGLTFAGADAPEAPWRVTAVDADSPAAKAGIEVGWTLTAVADEALEAADIHEDPDALFDAKLIDRFFHRQGVIARHLGSWPVEFRFVDGSGATKSVRLETTATPLRALGLLFWVQWLGGLGSLALAGWVLAARPGDFAARLLFISAAGATLGIWSSAIYTTREIAIDGTLFRVLSAVNGFGIGCFALAFAALLLVYPRRFAPRWVAGAMLALPALANLAEATGWPGDVRWTRIVVVAGGLLLALVLAFAQWFASRRDPLARAATRWIFLSLLASIVFFASVAVVPSLHGRSLTIPQGYMMAFSVVFFGGIAIAVARYRLFSIETWSNRLLFYLLGALLLFLLDVALVNVIHLANEVAFGIAMLVVGFVYLPLRGLVWKWLAGSVAGHSRDHAFAAATGIALEPLASERERRWREVLEQNFKPLSVVPAGEPVTQSVVRDEGLRLVVPPSTGGPGLALHGKAGGRLLFHPADAGLADSLIRFMSSVDEGRNAYARGATAERMRIARDLHDDVGARLLSAMHQSDETVRALLQDTLSDIRTLSGALAGEIVPLGQFLAETRHEASGRLAQCGIGLVWPPLPDDSPEEPVDYRQRKALASAIREIMTNIIRHSGADRVRVAIEHGKGLLTITIADNGRGAATGGAGKPNNGLRNIDHRIRDIAGSAHFNWSPTGLTVTLAIPLDPARPPGPGSG